MKRSNNALERTDERSWWSAEVICRRSAKPLACTDRSTVDSRMARDLISAKTRQEFREYFVSTTLATINDAFRAEGFDADLAHEPPVGGQRRTLVEQYYYYSVNWRDPEQVGRILHVYEAVLVNLDLEASGNGHNADLAREKAVALRRWLTRDGVKEDAGRLFLPGHRSLDTALASIDAPELQRQIDRMRAALDTDPGLAIGTAKELVETTCKTILTERGTPPDPGWDVPRLVKETRKVLTLLSTDIDDAAKGADSIRQLLSNLGSLVNGLAELRNLYGTGHGKHGKAKGVHPRHARLAVGAAATLATFLLETHEARDS